MHNPENTEKYPNSPDLQDYPGILFEKPLTARRPGSKCASVLNYAQGMGWLTNDSFRRTQRATPGRELTDPSHYRV